MPMQTPHFGHKPIKMRRVSRATEVRGLGDFYWFIAHPSGNRSLVVAIPHKSPSGWVMSEWSINWKNGSNAEWNWNQDEDNPTLKPSLHAVGMWHGWVRNGFLVEA